MNPKKTSVLLRKQMKTIIKTLVRAVFQIPLFLYTKREKCITSLLIIYRCYSIFFRYFPVYDDKEERPKIYLYPYEDKGNKDFMKYFNKINKKHVDFVLAKPENLQIELLIELDDNSHDKEKGKERDEFVEKILEKTGYKLLRTRGTAELKKLRDDIEILQEKSPFRKIIG